MPDYLGANPDCAKAKPVSVGAAPAATGMIRPKWRRPRQPHPGTRIIHYRCFLPDLAGFADYRRGGTDGATMDVGLFLESPARQPKPSRLSTTGGEGGIRTRDTGISRIHTFQACSFNHSDTSPHAEPLSHHPAPGGMVRLVLSLTPRFRSGPACGCPNSFLRICRTRDTGISRIHTFQACSFNHSDTSPHAEPSHQPNRGW